MTRYLLTLFGTWLAGLILAVTFMVAMFVVARDWSPSSVSQPSACSSWLVRSPSACAGTRARPPDERTARPA